MITEVNHLMTFDDEMLGYLLTKLTILLSLLCPKPV